MTFGKGHHLHLIDGSAFIFRAYHALPPLTRKSDGLPVGAVAGFCNLLWNELSKDHGAHGATHLAVIFDHSSKTFRNEIYPAYKANRPELPEDLRPQFPLTRDATRAFNIACIETQGFEADDLIATMACRARAAGGRVTIISSDKDLMQLVGDGVDMFDPMKNKRINRDEVFEKFGVGPERVVDVQALAGDSVDNVPGAPGIGIKTAALLIQEYGDLETLLERAGEIKQSKRRESLLENIKQIRISKRLVTLDCDMVLDFSLESLEVAPPNADDIMAFLHKMEFLTLTRRVAEALKVTPPAPDQAAGFEPGSPDAHLPALPFDTHAYEHVQTPGALQRWIDAVYERGVVAIDTETTSLDEMKAKLVGISLCVHAGQACYIPLGHRAGMGDLFGASKLVEGQMPIAQALALLKPMLEDPSILKIGQNMKYDAKIFARQNIRVAPIDDTMLMSYAMNAGLHGHGMDALCAQYLNHEPIAIKSLLGTGKSATTFDQVEIAPAVAYGAEDADITLRLWELFKPRLHRAGVTTVYETLDRPLVPVLAQMEMHGILVDREVLSRMSNAFAQKMASLEAEIYETAGQNFNVASPKQLGEILFDKMSLPGGVKGKTDAYATGADILEDLAAEGHTLPGLVLDWRQLAKLKSTYTDALQDHINGETGRVHTSYALTGAVTGRLSSTDPNLQNIPIRSEEGRRIREAFIAPEGRLLISLDYSQIELRILAHIADIPSLKQAFKDGHDIHAMTASEMFNVPLDQMTPDIRRQAKAINFGVIYGISGFGLARNLRIPRAQAQGFIDRYFERFPGIKTYMDDTIAFAKSHAMYKRFWAAGSTRPTLQPKDQARGLPNGLRLTRPFKAQPPISFAVP